VAVISRNFTSALKSATRILENHPELSFDIEEALLSLKEVGDLERRLAAFNTSRQEKETVSVAERDISNVLASAKLSKVQAYQGLGTGALSALPLMDRQAFQNNSSSYINQEFASQPLWETTTYGTTGFPISIYSSAGFYFDQLFLSLIKISSRVGFNAERNRVYAAHVTDTHGQRITVNPMGRNEATIRLIIDQFDDNSIRQASRILIDLQPCILCARSEIIEVLAQFSECSQYRPELVVCSGSFLEDERRERFKHFFSCPVVNAYGLTEFGPVASECSATPGWLHIDRSIVHHEFAADSEVHPTHELVLSSVSNMAMPLLRYRTGDIVRVENNMCICGSVDPQVSMSSGRLVPTFKRRSGRLFSPTIFNGLSASLPIAKYQVIQENINQLVVLIHPRVGALSDLIEPTLRYVQSASRNEFDVRVGHLESYSSSNFQRYKCMI